MLYNKSWGKGVEPTPQSILYRAANLIREKGLAKWEQQASDGSVCLHGAISIAATGRPAKSGENIYAAEQLVYNYLTSNGVPADNIKPTGMAYWNNAPSRTAEEVIEALEGAAALACCED
jgi:hypothetical protein